MDKVKRAAPVAFGLGLLVLAAFPFSSLTSHPHWDRITWMPFVSGRIKLLDVVGNLLVTVPAGVSLASRYGLRPVASGAVIGVVSLCCEAAQVFSHGRFPSATDVVCNVSGAALAAAWWMSRYRFPAAERSPNR